jgi:hypothetical protein
MKELSIVSRDSEGNVTNRQVRRFSTPAELGEFILCQQNNPRTETVAVLLPPGPRIYTPSPAFAKATRTEALMRMEHLRA